MTSENMNSLPSTLHRKVGMPPISQVTEMSSPPEVPAVHQRSTESYKVNVEFATDCKVNFVRWFTETEQKGIKTMIWLEADHAAVQENLVDGIPLKSLLLYQHIFEFFDLRHADAGILVVNIEKDGGDPKDCGDPKDSGPGGRSMKWVTSVTRFLLAIVKGFDGAKPDSKTECRKILRLIDEKGLLPTPVFDCATVFVAYKYGDALFAHEVSNELPPDLEANCGKSFDTRNLNDAWVQRNILTSSVLGDAIICAEWVDTLVVDLELYERCIGSAGEDTLHGGFGNDVINWGSDCRSDRLAVELSVCRRKNNDVRRVVKSVPMSGRSVGKRRHALESLYSGVFLLGCSGNRDFTVTGGSGFDTLAYNNENRKIGVSTNGNSGADVINAGAGRDILYGGQGADIVFSDDRSDRYCVEVAGARIGDLFLSVIASGDNTSAHGMKIGEEEMSTPFAAYHINEEWSLSQAAVATLGANGDYRPRKLYMSVDNKASLDQPEINGSRFDSAPQPLALLPETDAVSHRDSENSFGVGGVGLASVPDAITFTITTDVGTRTRPLIPEVPRVVDVRAIRDRRGMTQDEFATAFGLSVASLRNWEQGTRMPERPIALYLRLIDKYPNEVMAEVALARALP